MNREFLKSSWEYRRELKSIYNPTHMHASLASLAHHLPMHPLSGIQISANPNTLPMPKLCALFSAPQLLLFPGIFCGCDA